MEVCHAFRTAGLGVEGVGRWALCCGESWTLWSFIRLHLSVLSTSRKHQDSKKEEEKKKPHIKKPLNAFMLYMKEMRAKVVAECTLKESAAINQILGRRVGDPRWGRRAHRVGGPCPHPHGLGSPFPLAPV